MLLVALPPFTDDPALILHLQGGGSDGMSCGQQQDDSRPVGQPGRGRRAAEDGFQFELFWQGKLEADWRFSSSHDTSSALSFRRRVPLYSLVLKSIKMVTLLCGTVLSAISRDLLCNDLMKRLDVLAVPLGAEPLHEVGLGSAAIRCNDRSLGVNPLGLDPIPPRALDRQATDEHPPLPRALGLPVGLTKPGGHCLTEVPTGIVPNPQEGRYCQVNENSSGDRR